MEKYTGIIIFFLLCFGGLAFAQDSNWEKEFTADLLKGKQELTEVRAHEALAYTRTEEMILEDAIAKAIRAEGEACQIMKISIDMDYNPYFTLRSIYKEGEIDFDQLCMCATETGISKQIIAKAAVDADDSLRDEIAQAQCFEDVGLGYTQAQDTPPRIESPEKPIPVSVSSPQN